MAGLLQPGLAGTSDSTGSELVSNGHREVASESEAIVDAGNESVGRSGDTSQSTSAAQTSTSSEAGSSTEECDVDDADIVIDGSQTEQYKELDLAAESIIDATGALWLDVADYPVRISGGKGVCWVGGSIRGSYPDTDSWDRMHDTAAFSVTLSGFLGIGIRVHNYGDAINIVDNAHDFTIRQAHLTHIRDDCIENDRLHGGVVEESLLDGCYTAFSARPNSRDSTSDGRDNLWTIRDSLIRLEPMPTVYKGDAPGHGRFFKWDKDQRGPKLALHNNVFRADQLPNGGNLGVPEGYLFSCSDNIVVWLGDGDFPDPLPDCFTVTTDQSVWPAGTSGSRSCGIALN